MSRGRKRYITLLEMLVVMALLATISGLVSVNIASLRREQHFYTEVSVVKEKMRLAQNLMLILGKDVLVRFTPQPTGVTMKLECDEITGDYWSKEMQREVQLTALRAIRLEDDRQGPHKTEGITLKFLSGGSFMSSGLLRLAVAESDEEAGTLVRYLCLPGYPQAIQPLFERREDATCSRRETEQDRQLTRLTVEEVSALSTRPAASRTGS